MSRGAGTGVCVGRRLTAALARWSSIDWLPALLGYLPDPRRKTGYPYDIASHCGPPIQAPQQPPPGTTLLVAEAGTGDHSPTPFQAHRLPERPRTSMRFVHCRILRAILRGDHHPEISRTFRATTMSWALTYSARPHQLPQWM